MAKRKEKKLTPARPQLGDNVEILSAGEVLESAITDTLETNYMPYAMSVIVSRALPEIDGFKRDDLIDEGQLGVLELFLDVFLDGVRVFTDKTNV